MPHHKKGLVTPPSFLHRWGAALGIACAAALGCLQNSVAATDGAPLTTIEYRISGTMLQVSPAVVAVPKGIAGSVMVSVISGGSTNSPGAAQLSTGAYVEAVLRGPAFPEPRRLVGAPNAALMLPVLNLVGDYQLDGIRLVDSLTGAVRIEGVPSAVPIRVFDEILVSRVTSRPLTLEEIQEKGIYIDESNFRAVEFEVAFVVDGKTIPISFPVVAPKFTDSTEIIPAAELEARLKEAAVFNQQIATEVVQLPPEFETSNLNIQIQGINFQPVDEGETPSLALTIPPIPALMVIPGNIGFLNQFFSVQVFTENAAPMGSGLMVSNVLAKLVLPPGPDRIPAVTYAEPGDDPLRFARVGPDRIIMPVQTIVRPGPDATIGTVDDIDRLNPGESGEAEFLVEGLQEGLHVMDLDLTADMYGLAAGMVKVKGKAAGSVLVRNPRFSLAFSHPRTIRAGEPYKATITILNTGVSPANLVNVSLNRNSLSGVVFEPGQSETVELGTIMPGQTATATYRLRAQRTGSISFSNLTTSDDSTVGRFRFSMGVDERGVALSPDTLAMPSYVDELPPGIVAAANRVLGQALSIATAGQLPSNVTAVAKSTITRRVLELAEAGQRVRYGDPLNRVLPDLMLDWQGGRTTSAGFDEILRVTEAGAEWRAAIFNELGSIGGTSATGLLEQRVADLAGLGQSFVLASTTAGTLSVAGGEGIASGERSDLPRTLVYAGTNGSWAIAPGGTNLVLSWTVMEGAPPIEAGVLLVGSDGRATQLRWSLPGATTNMVCRLETGSAEGELLVDLGGDGSIDQRIAAARTLVTELPPVLVSVEQDMTVISGRPANPCMVQEYGNYGTVVAVLFSKPMTQESAGIADGYVLDDGNQANSVQIQPSGRVALLGLKRPISAIRPRTLIVQDVKDTRGNLIVGGGLPVRCVDPKTALPFTAGVAVKGRVIKGDGTPAAGVPVTLTMNDQVAGLYGCEAWIRRVAQVLTDSGGDFQFDFVLAGIPYTISATDTSGLSEEAIRVILESTVKDSVDRQHLEDLANAEGTRDTLLGMFAAASLPQAIAKVEGLDRALINDFVAVGSSREGQVVPFALRFRGRANVIGKVVGADGVTPVAGAAVNLFPDPDSREQGRGILADENGQFAFVGVPLGVYTIDVKAPDRRNRTIIGLLDVPGQTATVTIALPNIVSVYATLRGRVYEADDITPHGNGKVYIGKYSSGDNRVTDVVRIADVDADGFWEAAEIPVRTYDLVAVTFDGRRKGTRLNITPAVTVPTHANITLENVTRVFGRVQFEDGRPATNALVAGGVALVRSDLNGNFELEGVPVGSRQISAGLERDPAAGIDFPRLGSASVNVTAGQDNFVVVRLRSAGRIFGQVLDAQGHPAANIRVAIPLEGGFYWTDTDGNGNYSFENLGLGDYTVSAPANATAPKLDENKLIAQIRSGDEDQILAAFEEAARVFVGVDDPTLTGEHAKFRPSTWGYTQTRLIYDGQSVNANIRFLVQGTVAGRVLNHQGVPIGARIRLTGLGPSLSGRPTITIRGERDTDPATGEFTFTDQLLAGPWTLQVASPFYPDVLSKSGFTTEIDPDVLNVEFKFPPIREVNGRIAGHVLNPDGTPTGGGVRVKIDFSADYEIQTDTNGFFDTQISLPANRGYTLDAFDPSTGLRGRSYIGMTPGITNMAEIHLITRNSTIFVKVKRGNGKPAAGAVVRLDHGSFPYEANLNGVTDTNGVTSFSNLWEGNYAAYATYQEGSTRVSARGGISAGANEERTIELVLTATGSIEGTFVKTDYTTPVYGAQITVGGLGYATSDEAGHFRFDGMPMGTYRILSSDPVTGAYAVAWVTLAVPDQVEQVLLVEGMRGEVNGYVIDSYETGFTPGATVRIGFSDGLTPGRSVTTGPDGRFSFPGSPMGNYNLDASYTMPSGVRVSGYAGGILNTSNLVSSVNVPLEPLAFLAIHVLRPDGITGADNTRVLLNGPGLSRERDTDTNGWLFYGDLHAGGYGIRAISRNGGELHSGTNVSFWISSRGSNAPVVVQLPGVGSVQGTVVTSDGATPIPNVEVVLQMQRAPFNGESVTALSDGLGRFSFNDVAVGPFRLSAASQSLAATLNGTVQSNAVVEQVTLRLGDSGTILGRVVRADGTKPVGGVDVVITYRSQTSNPGRAFFRTAADGLFQFNCIPLGDVQLTSAALDVNGIILRSFKLATNGQVLNTGDLRFDEELPSVVLVNPRDGAIEVPTTASVDVIFSEAMSPASVYTGGIFIRGVSGRVNSSLSVLQDTNGLTRLVRITPQAPLVSQQTYEVVVVSGQLFGSGGGVAGTGPTDLEGRFLTASFISQFRTADNDPPLLLSIFPTNHSIQIDPRAVPRMSFNEALRATGFVFSVVGPNGPVQGQASLGVNGQVLSFLPTVELPPNGFYSMVLSNVFDLAGNRAVGEPFTATFRTLDTIGPTIASLQIVSNAAPIAGKTISIQAVMADTNEPLVTVRFTQDLQPLGTVTNAPFKKPINLAAPGITVVRAIATDQYGNDGPLAELQISIQPNQPPTIQFTRVAPVTGPVPSGSFVAVDVFASDDSGISQLKAIVAGIASGNLLTTNANRLRVQGLVPTNAHPGLQVEIYAEAFDDLGTSSGQQVLVIPIRDAAPPNLAITAPAADTRIEAGTVQPITVQLMDNFGVVRVETTVTGGFTNVFDSVPAQPISNGLYQVALQVPSSAPTNGEAVQLSMVAWDAAGNSSGAAELSLRMHDRTAPSILAVNPPNGSTDVDVVQVVTAVFSEALDTNSVNSTNFVLRVNDGGEQVGTTLSVSNQATIVVTPLQPLLPQTAYQFVIAGTVTDVEGNPLGLALTNEFRTAEFRLVRPSSGQPVVEGQMLIVEAAASTLTPAKVRFSADQTTFAEVVSRPYTNAYLVPMLSALGTNRIVFGAEALDADDARMAFASATVNVVSGSLDSDGDGVSNADELARGTDPFVPNASPHIECTNLFQIVQGVPTNFTFSASDADGNLRRLEVREDVDDTAIRLFGQLQFKETGGIDFALATNAATLSATVTLRYDQTNQAVFFIRAVDSDNLTAVREVQLVVLADLDGDTIPDRDDPDIDGDGLSNVEEFAIGTDPRRIDTDEDTISDSEEIVAGADGFITDPLQADTDADTVQDAFEIALGLDPTNPSDGSKEIVINNRIVTYSGSVRLGTLILTNGAVLAHAATTGSTARRLEMVLTNLIIDASSRIDVSGRGYLGGRSGDNPGDTARTFGNTTIAGSTRRNGGAYGGIGGFGNAGGNGNFVYGSFQDPNEMGSGGGSDQGNAGNGGGLFRCNAESIVLDGQIVANGFDGSRYAGGGSGGGIRIVAGRIRGAGSIKANGGNAGLESGGGGGGRIALHFADASEFALTNVQAFGGNGLNVGTPGSIYFKSLGTGQTEALVIDGGGANNIAPATPIVCLPGDFASTIAEHSLTDRKASFSPGSLIGLKVRSRTDTTHTFRVIGNDSTTIYTDPADGSLMGALQPGGLYTADLNVGRVSIRNGATVEIVDGDSQHPERWGHLNTGELELLGSARLTHPATTASTEFTLYLVVTNTVRIDGASRIDVSDRGYPGGRSGGNGGDIARTFGNTTEGGSMRRNGGTYGGLGGIGTTAGEVNQVYGDFKFPFELGSGGGSDEGSGGDGGGLIYMRAGRLELEGTIAANGRAGSRYAGGGSGGAINMEIGVLAGNGQIAANGGSAGIEAGGGGGGRIAILFTDAAGLAFTNVLALGGQGRENGAPGTIYLEHSGETGQLIVRGSGRETPLPSGNLEARLMVDAATLTADNLQVASLILTNGATLTHAGATASSTSLLNIKAVQVDIDASSRIDVSSRGYLGGRRVPGYGDAGWTLGNASNGSARRTGGSYGGLGAFGTWTEYVNPGYGTYHDPNELGSGGGADDGVGGNGGGLVRLEADTLNLAGAILADGGAGNRYSGGGSGGGIRIQVGALTGGGSVSAVGGPAGLDSGGGGGGRIAVLCNNAGQDVLNHLHANGGVGSQGTGGAGTIYTRLGTEPGLVVVSGSGRETALGENAVGDNVRLDSATVQVQQLNALKLELLNGAVLTHPGAGLTDSPSLEITVHDLIVSTNSRIDVSARGFLGGRSGLNGNNIGRTLGNKVAGGSDSRIGGSYGGLGATGTAGWITGAVYGMYSDPDELGSGGGSDYGSAGNGGGLVRIVADTILLDGQVLANGGSGTRYGGGGSGGGVKIATRTMSGAGFIQASGGSGAEDSGGGGGGRIAVYCQDAPAFSFAAIEAKGGGGRSVGGPGTILTKMGADIPGIVIRGNGRETPLPFLSGEHLLVDGSVVSVTNLVVTSVLLTNGAVLTQPPAEIAGEPRLDLTATNIVISGDSRIDVSARGYLGGRSGANGGDQGRTLGNTTVGGSTRRNGASYGGLGGIGTTEGVANMVYGEYRDPNELGSGGGSEQGPGGSGGGLLRLNAGHMTLDGQILANGGDGSRYAGGGSGGGVKVVVNSLSGSGTIHANGGIGGIDAGGGGGGRVAIYCNSTSSRFDTVQANGGSGRETGAPGTILVRLGTGIPQIVIRSTGRETPLPTNLAGEQLVLDGAVVSATNMVLASLSLTNGAVLTHAGADLANEPRLEIVATNLVISSDSRIDVSARGYLGGRSGANGGDTARTLGNTNAGGSTRRNGGSHGGSGAIGTTAFEANLPYGSFRNPNELGSGGGSDSGAGGNGGGLVRITADRLVLEGAILANGGAGSRYGGGGAGGGIRVLAGTLTGQGRITADGGGSGIDSGGGGGGRIAVYYDEAAQFGFTNVTAFGGFGGYSEGSPGSIYTQDVSASAGRLVLDAGNHAPSRATQIYSLAGGINTGVGANWLSDTNASFVPGGLVGLLFNPRIDQARLFTIVSNTESMIFTSAKDGDMTAVASSGQAYAAELSVGHFVVANSAIAELLDGDRLRADQCGRLRALTAEILNGGWLRHPVATPEAQFGLELILNERLTVDASSRVDVSNRGYLGGRSGANTGDTARTLGNTTINGSTRRTGGSYAGQGGFGTAAGSVNPTYGDPYAPANPGSGGGSDQGSGGNGGGVLRVVSDTIAVDGSILASGGAGSRYAGGGSGGSVWLTARLLTGAGVIQANGGNGDLDSGGGGGGRIAVRYQEVSGFPLESMTAIGGGGYSSGGKGSVFVAQTNYVFAAAPLPETGIIGSSPEVLSTSVADMPVLVIQRQSGIASDTYQVRFTGSATGSVVLQTSTDLVHWSNVQTNASPVEVTVAVPMNAPQRFYRVIHR